jgi:putative sugar O-methyltransferase
VSNFQTEKQFKINLEKLMNESYAQNDLYQPGNYWKFYEKNILKQIDNNKLSEFRSWKGGSGKGNVQSFGGGAEIKSRKFLRNFHPIDDDFNFIDDSIFIKKYNSLINKLIPFFSFSKFFLLRISELKQYYKDLYKLLIIEKYNSLIKEDRSLEKISDSKFGLNQKDLVYINGKIYTLKLLQEIERLNYIKKNLEFEKINHIIEIGAGIGLLADAFFKLKRNIKYLIIDIPPTICFSEYYLKNLSYKVFGYQELSNRKKVDIKKIFENYDVICLPPWKLNEVKNYSFDLFMNIQSFQEMEKNQTFNYLSITKKNLIKNIYLENSITGHLAAKKKNDFGVLEQSKMSDVEKYLSDDYDLSKKNLDSKNTTELKKKYISIFKKK